MAKSLFRSAARLLIPNIKCGIGIEDRIFRQSMIPPRMVFAEIGNDEPLLQAKPGGDFYRQYFLCYSIPVNRNPGIFFIQLLPFPE